MTNIDKLAAIERNIAKNWQITCDSSSTNDYESYSKACSSLASSFAYLLNLFLCDRSMLNWKGFGADDLLDASYSFPTDLRMVASGLMCWGDMGQNMYLSPFLGEFKRDARTDGLITDFELMFSPHSQSEGPCTVPYTNDYGIRRKLLEAMPRKAEDWAQRYHRKQALRA